MNNNLESILENRDLFETLIFGDQTFSNEIVQDQSAHCSILGTITFFKVDLTNVDFTGSTFVNCKFKDCRLKGVIFRKCDFWNITFENCDMENVNLTRATFNKGSFRNCMFSNSNLTASSFSDYKFMGTKFYSSDLDLIGATFVKVWKLNQCTEIKDSSNLGNLLDNISFDS